MRETLGINKQGLEAKRAKSSLTSGSNRNIGKVLDNKHIFAVGVSGSGKSTALLSVITQLVTMGVSVFVINWRNVVKHEQMLPGIRKIYEEYAKVIDVAKERIGIHLFRQQKDPNSGELETITNVKRRVVNTLAATGQLTPAQCTRLEESVERFFSDNIFDPECRFIEEGIKGLGDELKGQGKAAADHAWSKLGAIFANNLVVDGDFFEDGSLIYEFDLNGLDKTDQACVCRFILEYLFRLSIKGQFVDNGIAIFLDECQNFDFSEESTLNSFLNEGRRMNVQMILGTSSLKSTSRRNMHSIMNCAQKMYFKPMDDDVRSISELIDPNKPVKWKHALSTLKQGEYILTGNIEVAGRAMMYPQIVTAYTQMADDSESYIDTNKEATNVSGIDE